MTRVKTFDSTGVAPNGRLYAGDLNAMQDHYADLANFAQTVDVSVLRFGASDLQWLRFGAGAGGITSEARLTGSMRADGIIRGLGGFIAGTFTTTQRDAIASGGAPYGTMILNSTTNQYEWNNGTDAARTWAGLGFVPDGSVTLAKLAANSVDSSKIVDASIVNADIAAAAAIAYSKLALANSLVNNDIAPAAAIAYSKLNLANSIATGDLANLAVTAAKIANDTITATQIAANAIGSSELADSSVDSAAIIAAAVTPAKLSVKYESGIHVFTTGAADFAVSFTAGFSAAPNVVTQAQDVATGVDNGSVLGVSAAGFTLRNGSGGTQAIGWLAIGT